MTRIQANSGIKRRRFSISGILFSVAMLVSAIGAAAGQCLLNEDLVMEFFRSRPLLPLDAALWSIFPGVSLLIASGIVFALATRRLFWSTRAGKEGRNPADPSLRMTPTLTPGLEALAGLSHSVWWLVIQFVAAIVGLGLAGYLAGNLLAGKYSPELPLVEIGCLCAFLLALICDDVRRGSGAAARSSGGEASGLPSTCPPLLLGEARRERVDGLLSGKVALRGDRVDDTMANVLPLIVEEVEQNSPCRLVGLAAGIQSSTAEPPVDFNRKWFPLRPRRETEPGLAVPEVIVNTPSVLQDHDNEAIVSPSEGFEKESPLPPSFPEKEERVRVRAPGWPPSNVFKAMRSLLRPQTLAEAAFVVLMSGLFVYLNIRDLTNAAYAALGDEYSFFNVARGIAMGAPVNLFSQRGVFGYHPVLDSAYQALVMGHFGINQFGWKLSGVLIVALSFLPLYLFARHLFGVLTAILATAVTTSSHYLFAYAHTGYNNIHSVFPTVLSLFAVGFGISRRSSALLFLAGAFAGLGFYTFFSARFAIAALLLTLLLEGVVAGQRLAIFRLMFFAAAGFAVATFPIFAIDRMDVFNAMLSNSVASLSTNWLGLAEEVSKRSLQALLGFSYNPAAVHYVSGSLLEPLSAALAALGIVVTLLRLNDWRFRFLLVWLIVGLVVAGGFYHGFNIAMSRLMILVPILAIFAAVVAGEFVQFLTMRFRRRFWRVTITAVVVSLLVGVIFAANLQRFWSITPARLPVRPETLAVEAVLSKEIDHATLASAVVVAPAPDALARLVFDSYVAGSQNPVFLNAGEKTFVERYADSPLIVFIETSDADEKAIFSRLKLKAPEAMFAEKWDRSHKQRVGIINNPTPTPSAILLQAGFPAGLRAVMRLGGLGKSEGTFNSPRDVAIDRNGNLYVADAGNHRVQKFDAAGNFLMVFGGAVGSEAYLKAPVSVAADSAGGIAVLDGGDPGMKRFAANGAYLGKLGSDLGLSLPRSIAFDSSGSLYVADAGRVLKVSDDGQIISTITGSGAGAQFRDPTGLAVDATGRLFVVDGVTGVVSRFDSQGRFEANWETPARGGEAHPKIAIGPDGSIVVSAPTNRAVLKFSSTGQPQGSFSGETIVGQRLEVLAGLAVDSKGFVYVVDSNRHELSRLAFY